jgi:hypothetical protein
MAAKKRKVNSPPTKVECSFALTFPGAEQKRRERGRHGANYSSKI